jgi:hypothetical protein
MRLIFAGLLALTLALSAAGTAHATAIISIEPDGTLLYRPDTDDDVDQFAVIDLGDRYRFTRFNNTAQLGAGSFCNFVGGDTTVDCQKSGVTGLRLDLGGGNDIAVVAPSVTVPVLFLGGAGNDALFGGGGVDVFQGGTGDDNIVARDTRAESVDCGDGHDTAVTDDTDLRSGCEEIEGDADGDGVRRPSDCDDTKVGIHPGAVDVPDNGIDENCDGLDAVDLDRDHDGTPRPQDCDDANPAIRPTTAEVIGNQDDENCDGRVDPFPPLTGSVVGSWTRVHGRTRNLILVAKGFPAKTVIRLKCTRSPSCPKTVRRTVNASRDDVNLHLVLGKRTFSKRARIELSITRATRMGRVLRYRMGTPGLPDVEFLCRPPGGRAGPC